MRSAELDHDRLRSRVEHAGVPIFRGHRAPDEHSVHHGAKRGDGTRAPHLDAQTLAALLRDLLASGDARLTAAVPSVLASAGDAAPAIRIVADSLDAASRARLGLLHRVARALVVSRAPDLRQRFGAVPLLSPCADEPPDLPDPAADHGEALLRELLDPASEACATWGPLAGDAVDLFDTWLRLTAAPGLAHA